MSKSILTNSYVKKDSGEKDPKETISFKSACERTDYKHGIAKEKFDVEQEVDWEAIEKMENELPKMEEGLLEKTIEEFFDNHSVLMESIGIKKKSLIVAATSVIADFCSSMIPLNCVRLEKREGLLERELLTDSLNIVNMVRNTAVLNSYHTVYWSKHNSDLMQLIIYAVIEYVDNCITEIDKKFKGFMDSEGYDLTEDDYMDVISICLTNKEILDKLEKSLNKVISTAINEEYKLLNENLDQIIQNSNILMKLRKEEIVNCLRIARLVEIDYYSTDYLTKLYEAMFKLFESIFSLGNILNKSSEIKVFGKFIKSLVTPIKDEEENAAKAAKKENAETEE